MTDPQITSPITIALNTNVEILTIINPAFIVDILSLNV